MLLYLNDHSACSAVASNRREDRSLPVREMLNTPLVIDISPGINPYLTGRGSSNLVSNLRSDYLFVLFSGQSGLDACS